MQIAALSMDGRDAVDALTRSILNKLLHSPTVRLREAAGNGRGLAVLDSVRYLFELDEHGRSGAPEESVAPAADPVSPSLNPNPTRT